MLLKQTEFLVNEQTKDEYSTILEDLESKTVLNEVKIFKNYIIYNKPNYNLFSDQNEGVSIVE